ncbi:hypothetical protein C8R43DRAFT_1134114 [Mycena crocata]|nr:hypothetical protein C8R43DRAFT_1134114 [Mycena crocata]
MPKFTAEAGAALVFLIGYLAIFGWMLFAFLTYRIKWCSRYALLFFHVTIRVASQSCGIAFGILGFSNFRVFLAYLILGAEGYFTLVLCAFRFLISWHQHNLTSGQSWLEPRDPPGTNKVRNFLLFILLGPFAFVVYRSNPMAGFHLMLVLANAAIVIGGSFLAGADYNDPESANTKMCMQVATVAWTTGQGIFFAGNAALLLIILVTMRNNRRDGDARGKKGSVHPTLVLLLIVWFPLIVRGMFGLLQASVNSLSYYNRPFRFLVPPASKWNELTSETHLADDNYNASGFTPRFTTIEYRVDYMRFVELDVPHVTQRSEET